jgi:hypothetical protein
MENNDPAYIPLRKFVGTWSTEGRMVAAAGEPAILIKGTDRYGWLPGGFFLMHKVDVLVGGEENKTTEIIGYDALRGHFTLQYFDNKGNTGSMTATCSGNNWVFQGENLRFTGGFNEVADVFAGSWEQRDDTGKWKHLMDIKLTRQRG